ncbi:MAG TPA: hypothetical protein VKG44_05910 [Candidatus Baltobacteraceae bacterium]|nr:hypothetical protein [Candidatus Baltobacteraceae bacterium]
MRRLVTLCCAVAFLAATANADAHGTTRVQLKDGKVTYYSEVRFTVAGRALTLSSPDGKGSLRIAIVNCVQTGQLHRCEPGGAEYRQNGEVRGLEITSGTLYFNTTGQLQTLTHSSMQIPPYGVMLAFHTAHGTYVTSTASLDGLKK